MTSTRYCFPQQFTKLHKAESPDLQDEKNSLEIEVACAISSEDQQISDESLKYAHAKTDAERESYEKMEEIEMNSSRAILLRQQKKIRQMSRMHIPKS